MNRTQSTCQTGLTFLEMAIALAIVAVLAVAAIPSLLDRWQRETVVVLAEQFASAISLARTTAQHRHVWTYFRPQDPAHISTSPWKVSLSPPGSVTAAQENPLLLVSVPTLPPVRVSTNLPDDTLSYAPVGYSRKSNDSLLQGTLTITSGRHTRRVRINPVGRARICDPDTDSSSCPATSSDP